MFEIYNQLSGSKVFKHSSSPRQALLETFSILDEAIWETRNLESEYGYLIDCIPTHFPGIFKLVLGDWYLFENHRISKGSNETH